MRNRVNDLYKEVCIPKPKNQFIVVDKELGETVESKDSEVLHGTPDDIIIYFVT